MQSCRNTIVRDGRDESKQRPIFHIYCILLLFGVGSCGVRFTLRYSCSRSRNVFSPVRCGIINLQVLLIRSYVPFCTRTSPPPPPPPHTHTPPPAPSRPTPLNQSSPPSGCSFYTSLKIFVENSLNPYKLKHT